MNQKLDAIFREVQKALTGKQAVVEKVLMAMLCGGHILLDDVPGVGKTTLAVAFSKALGLRYRRIQFTPDVLPSDIVGFSMYDKQQNAFRYVPGIVTGTNLLLGDEINRTSSKTQSALLEAMEEKQVTVDGICYPLPDPFCVIATQNQVGTAGTQPLPNAQMDRFLVQLTIGYPDYESQMALIRDRQLENPMEQVQQAADAAALVSMQQEVRRVAMDDKIIDYITRLAMASREHPLLRLGISPRGALAVSRMAKACAYLHGRDYTLTEDVQEIFADVCAHRVLLSQQAKTQQSTAQDVMQALLREVALPDAAF